MNCKYSLNDLTAKFITEKIKVIKLTTAFNSKSREEKIYTETDFQKVLDFVCSESFQDNPFCKNKDCFDILPNHSHSEEKDKERKLMLLLKIKIGFFVEEWFYFYKTGGNELESEISKKFAPIFEGKVYDGKKIQEAYDLFRPYIKNIETHIPHSPKLELTEKKWRNKKVREKRLKKENLWDQWQELQLTVMVEKPNLFSSPATWILIVVVLLLATIGRVFYRRRKNNEKRKKLVLDFKNKVV